MKQLEFSYNWNNKLACDCFTTLRISNRFDVGELVDISLNDRHLSLGTVIAKTAIRMGAINEFIARLDTGYSAAECKEVLRKMYPGALVKDTDILYLYLVEKERKEDREKRLYGEQQQLFA